MYAQIVVLLGLVALSYGQLTVRMVLHAEGAPKPLGPYSEGVRLGDTIFVSGNIGVDPNTGELVPGGIGAETKQALINVGSILKGGNVTYNNVVKTTVLLADINDFDEMNKVYSTFFLSNFPTRTTFQVAALPKNARVEIDCIAAAGKVVDISANSTLH